MKLMKSALICCALLIAGTLSACEVSDAPQQDGTLNSREPVVTEIVENNNGGDQAAGGNGDTQSPLPITAPEMPHPPGTVRLHRTTMRPRRTLPETNRLRRKRPPQPMTATATRSAASPR